MVIARVYLDTYICRHWMTEVNRVCQVCGLRMPYLGCTCTVPATLLCSLCVAPHLLKNTRLAHLMLPLKALGDSEEYQRKSQRITKATEELRRNLLVMDELCAEIKDTREKIVTFLSEKLSEIEIQKEKLKRVIDQAVNEAEACLADGSLPKMPLAQAILLHQEHSLELFTYTHSDIHYQDWFSFQLTEPQALVFSQPLVYVEPTSLKVYNLARNEWKRVAIEGSVTHVDDGTRYVWTERGLSCSGGEKHAGFESPYTAFILNQHWKVTDMSEMTRGRSCHGLWTDTNRVFAFGGMSKRYSRQHRL